MSSSKRKWERIPSLNLENVLHSMNDDGVNLRTLVELQTTLANTDLRDVVKRDVIPEDLVLLWTVSKIGFLNTVSRPDLAVQPVRFWPYQFSTVLIKKPGKNRYTKIRYTLNHMRQRQTSWHTLPRALQQCGLICRKFRWCLTSQRV